MSFFTIFIHQGLLHFHIPLQALFYENSVYRKIYDIKTYNRVNDSDIYNTTELHEKFVTGGEIHLSSNK